MSIYAAIGYAVGVVIFAVIIRVYRQRLIQRHIDKAASRRQSDEEKLK